MYRMRWLGRCAVVVGLVAVAACGSDDSTADQAPARSDVPVVESTDSADPVPSSDAGDQLDVDIVAVAERSAPVASRTVAGQAITEFGLDLFGEVRSATPAENIAMSPASVAIALALVEPGAVDLARDQIRAILRIDDPAAFHASMNALEQDLETRTPGSFGEGSDPGQVTVNLANAAFLQRGYPFQQAYLDVVGSNYGPVLRTVDFAPDPDRVAHEINDFVADATNDQIVDLIADGTIRPETVLALVNALYLKASWLAPFNEAATEDRPFTLLDGTTVEVELMNGFGTSSASGDGWVGATKSYVGGLSAQFILPDEGRFNDVASNLTAVLADFDLNRTSGAELALPRFETRSSAELTPALQSLGLTAPYAEGGLLGVANDPRLIIDQVIHEAFIAMDEEGTEAAAATVVLEYPTSGPVLPPVPVVLDRPFLYRIIDDASGATLFIGQITNPTT